MEFTDIKQAMEGIKACDIAYENGWIMEDQMKDILQMLFKDIRNAADRAIRHL